MATIEGLRHSQLHDAASKLRELKREVGISKWGGAGMRKGRGVSSVYHAISRQLSL